MCSTAIPKVTLLQLQGCQCQASDLRSRADGPSARVRLAQAMHTHSLPLAPAAGSHSLSTAGTEPRVALTESEMSAQHRKSCQPARLVTQWKMF